MTMELAPRKPEGVKDELLFLADVLAKRRLRHLDPEAPAEHGPETDMGRAYQDSFWRSQWSTPHVERPLVEITAVYGSRNVVWTELEQVKYSFPEEVYDMTVTPEDNPVYYEEPFARHARDTLRGLLIMTNRVVVNVTVPAPKIYLPASTE